MIDNSESKKPSKAQVTVNQSNAYDQIPVCLLSSQYPLLS